MKTNLHFHTISNKNRQLINDLMSIANLSDFCVFGTTALALLKGHYKAPTIVLIADSEFNFKSIEKELSKYFSDIELLYFAYDCVSFKINGIKTDFCYCTRGLLKRPTEIEGIRFASIDDLFALKFDTIISSREKIHFIDLAELIHDHTFEWGMLCHQTKYKIRDKALVINGIASIEQADSTPMPDMIKKVEWLQVQEYITNEAFQFIHNEKERIKNKHLKVPMTV